MKTTTDGSVWLLGSEEMVRFKDGKVKQTYDLTALIVSGMGVRRFATYRNEVWFAHWNYGLLQLNVETGDIMSVPDPAYADRNDLLSIDSDGNKWTTKAVYEYNLRGLMADGSWQTAIDPDSLIGCPQCPNWEAYESFRNMNSDGLGNTFLFTYDFSLLRLRNGVVEAMALGFGFRFDGMTIDRNNQLWFYKTNHSTSIPQEAGLYRYNGSLAPTVVDLTEAFKGNVWPYDLTFDHNNNAWVATNLGIAVYNENGVEF
jgi:ligand-binding sensor domain-containing protein